MNTNIIHKDLERFDVTPNLTDYDDLRRTFSWEAAETLLDGLPHCKGLNIAHEAVDKHLGTPTSSRVALRWISRDGRVEDTTYRQLALATSTFANALLHLGLDKGDRLFALAGRVPELYVAALGTLKARVVFSPLFSAFGKEPVKSRIQIGEGKALLTTPTLYRRKVRPIRAELPSLKTVILIGEGAELFLSDPGVVAWDDIMRAASDNFQISPTSPDDMALLHFTNGTTGNPRGAIHVHQAVLAHMVTGHLALDLHPGDVFWCTADPAQITGTSYGIISPLTIGATLIIDEGDFSPDRWYRILAEQHVNVWYTAPTAVRMMLRAGADHADALELPDLRFIASVGDPLNPDDVTWGERAFGLPIHDSYWQTETGGIMIANVAACPIKPGSMGRPLPGIEAAVLVQGEDGAYTPVAEPDTSGQLAFRPGWPSMFRGYLHEDPRYDACFKDGWYLTGDVARQDEEGWIWIDVPEADQPTLETPDGFSAYIAEHRA